MGYLPFVLTQFSLCFAFLFTARNVWSEVAKAAKLERKKNQETCPPVCKGKKGHGGARVNSGRKKAVYNKVNKEFYIVEFSLTSLTEINIVRASRHP